MLLARYFEANIPKLAKKRVLELGAGTGLFSIYLGRCRACVISCDYNPLVIALLKKNVAANKVAKQVEVRAVLFLWKPLFDDLQGAKI
jgi:predicted nicotinamide N-methyase